MSLATIAQENFQKLAANAYPGRGIVLGLTPEGDKLIQVYWIMGRSENSRNRVFIQEDNAVRTAAHDPAKLEDPSLIIYYPVRVDGKRHIVSNGDQTDTVWIGLINGGTFEGALQTRKYEHDAPNFTPRITGLMDLSEGAPAYQLSILKSLNNTEDACLRQFFRYDRAQAGLGHGITTYQGDGSPLPSFAGEPVVLPIASTLQANLDLYWNALDVNNRVSLLVKSIEVATGKEEILIVNRHA